MGKLIDIADPFFAELLGDIHDEAYVAGAVAATVTCLESGTVSVAWLRRHLASTPPQTLDRALCSLLSQRILVPWSDRDPDTLPDADVVEVPAYGRVSHVAVP